MVIKHVLSQKWLYFNVYFVLLFHIHIFANSTSPTCCICFEEFSIVQEVTLQPCNHSLCLECAQRWIEQDSTDNAQARLFMNLWSGEIDVSAGYARCPQCREPIHTTYNTHTQQDTTLSAITSQSLRSRLNSLINTGLVYKKYILTTAVVSAGCTYGIWRIMHTFQPTYLLEQLRNIAHKQVEQLTSYPTSPTKPVIQPLAQHDWYPKLLHTLPNALTQELLKESVERFDYAIAKTTANMSKSTPRIHKKLTRQLQLLESTCDVCACALERKKQG